MNSERESKNVGHAVNSRVLAFGEFTFDTVELSLKNGNENVPLPPKSLELLAVLLESGGRLMTKNELFESVWAGTFVEEANLSHHIAVLRKALGDDRNGRKFIETVARRGYRFVEPVAETVGSPLISFSETSRTMTTFREEIEVEDDSASRFLTKRRLAYFAGATVVAGLLVAVIFAGTNGFFRFGVTKIKEPPTVVPLTAFTGQEIGAKISRDGRFVVYCGTNTLTGKPRPNEPEVPNYFNLYVKQVEGDSVLQLTNKQGRAMSPSWSPDGSFVAYAQKPEAGNVDKNFLYIIPALGGAEQKIFEAPELTTTAWSPDGKTIAFSARSDASSAVNIFTITLADRSVKQITSSADSDLREPAFSPDGSSIAYVSEKGKTTDVYVQSLNGGAPRMMDTENSYILGGLAWIPDGSEILYGTNRTGVYRLWSSPVDGSRPPKLVEGAGEPAQGPSVSADGKRLTYTRLDIDFNVWRVPLINGVGPAERAEKIVSSFRQDRAPAISPSGDKVVFVSNQNGAARQIWIADPDGQNQRQLTSFPEGSFAVRPLWSPDGSRLVFDASVAGVSAIYTLNVDSGLPQKVFANDSSETAAPSWSSDGRSIYFAKRTDGQWQLWKANPDGSSPIQVTKNGGYEAHESSDGKYIYYNKGGYGTLGVFRLPIDGGSSEEKVLDIHQVDSLGEWTLTDKGIYFLHRDEVFEVPSKQPRIQFLNFADMQITDVSPLPLNPLGNPGLSFSPNGDWLYYSINDRTDVDIMLVNNFK